MKPLIKKPSKFKEKLKSFFHVDIEKDLQEEEPTKVFEKIPLINLTRNKIFLGIFLFLVIVNCLVGFDINQFYIRAILGFIFLITVPGLLIMLCFKIRTVKFWEFLVYTIGLSIAFIMFAGLIVNWTLPALNITDKPLSLYPILICFDIFLVALGIVAWKRNKDFQPFQFTVPKLDAINNIFFIVPMLFPILAILGAFILNNHGSNILTMIMLGGIAVYVLLLVLFRKKLNENIWPWALWMIGLSILLSGWMRSWFINGVDNSLEYYIFQLTNSTGRWNLSNYYNAYNAMLSLNILPSFIGKLIDNTSQILFKFYFQIITSVLAIVSYLYIKKIFHSAIAFLSTLFFLSLPMLYSGTSIAIRQEIALIFFGLMLLVLFTKEINQTLKKILFLIFGASMIVSHYSTAYITLAIFTLTYFITLFYKRYENKKIKKGKLPSPQKSEFYLTGTLVLLLLLFGFLWYTQVTPTADSLIDFAGKSISNFGNLFNEDNQLGNGGIFGNIFTISNKQNPYEILTEYVQLSLNNTDIKNIYPSAQNFYPSLANPYETNLVSNYFLYSVKNYIEFFSRVLLFFGFIFLLKNKSKPPIIEKKQEFMHFKLIIISLMIITFFLIIAPFFSISYDLTRFYQQGVLIMSPLIVIGLGTLFFWMNKKKNLVLITLFILLYFVIIYGTISPIFITTDSTLRLTNYGQEYRQYYTNLIILTPSTWLKENYPNSSLRIDSIYAYRENLLKEYGDKFKIKIGILPQQINKEDYVYSGYNNNILGFGTSVYKSFWVSYHFPTDFLNENKNKIYNNGGSEIFK